MARSASGAGIFTLAGTVAKEDAGPGVTISFVVAGIASACATLSYAEFGGLIPKAGSAYTCPCGCSGRPEPAPVTRSTCVTDGMPVAR